MGHRALLARERTDDCYDCYYAHWGGADLSLARRLDDSEPCRLDDPGPHRDNDLDPRQVADPSADPAVDEEPIATGATREQVFADHLDPLIHEALVVLRPGGVEAYRPLWFGPVEGAAVVAVDPYAHCDDDRVLAWFQGTRDAVADLLADGAIEPETAATCLRRRVQAWTDDREVVFP